MAGALDRPGALGFRPELNGIKIQARRVNGWITSYGNKSRSIHRKVVMEMARIAAERLDETTVRSSDMRTGRLKAAILNPSSHVSTDSGFVFLDHDAMYGQVVYWRLIEEGTHMFVGRQRRFMFLSGKTGRRVQPNPNRRGQDTVMVGRELLSNAMLGQGRKSRGRGQRPYEGLPLIRIKTPIREHHYAQYAIEQFEAGNFAGYKSMVQVAAAELGLPLVIG